MYLTTGDFTNGAKILYMPTDFKSNILTLQLIRKKYNYIVPEFIKYMYEYSSTDRPRAASLIPWLVQYTCTYFRINCMGKMYRQNCRTFRSSCGIFDEWTPLPVHFINGWYNILVPVFELIVWGKFTVKTVVLFAPLG